MAKLPEEKPFISTHTLTWSVTELFSLGQMQNLISTHTLTWSVTKKRHNKILNKYFNSHAHVERDQLRRQYVESAFIISTHTLTWSVTLQLFSAFFLFVISTHTLTWSVTGHACGYSLISLISTHTLTWSVTSKAIPQLFKS